MRCSYRATTLTFPDMALESENGRPWLRQSLRDTDVASRSALNLKLMEVLREKLRLMSYPLARTNNRTLTQIEL